MEFKTSIAKSTHFLFNFITINGRTPENLMKKEQEIFFMIFVVVFSKANDGTASIIPDLF